MNANKFNKLIRHYTYSRKAVTKLYDAYYPLIVLHINRKFRGKVDGRDVAQQFFIDLFKMNLQERIRYPTAWVYKVADNIALMAMRKNIKRTAAEKMAAVPDSVCISPGASETLYCLSPPEQSVVYLRYWENYKLKEIAEMLAMKYYEVIYLHKTAKVKLKKEHNKEFIKELQNEKVS